MEIRRSYDRLISTMGFPILVRWHLYIESGPCRPMFLSLNMMSWVCIGSGNGLAPNRHQAIARTNADLFWILNFIWWRGIFYWFFLPLFLSKLTCDYIYHSTTCRIYIGVWIHKRHPIACPDGWAKGVFHEDFSENLLCYNGTTQYFVLTCYTEVVSTLSYWIPTNGISMG